MKSIRSVLSAEILARAVFEQKQRYTVLFRELIEDHELEERLGKKRTKALISDIAGLLKSELEDKSFNGLP